MKTNIKGSKNLTLVDIEAKIKHLSTHKMKDLKDKETMKMTEEPLTQFDLMAELTTQLGEMLLLVYQQLAKNKEFM